MTQLAKSNPKRTYKPRIRWTFDAIGTQWRIDILQPLSDKRAKQIYGAICERIEVFDRDYSRFREDSLVSAMAQRAGTYRLPADARPMIDLYAALYEQTNGAVTPLVGQLLADAGYDAHYSLKPGKLRRVPAWDDVLEYDFPHLTLRRPALLDFGAAGKGYLVDIVAGVLESYDVHGYSIDAGGDILHRGDSAPLRVGLEHPGNPSQVIGVATIANRSICGSAPTRRAWETFHHIMDPHRRMPIQHIRAVWVVADNAMVADALATCLFFVSPTKLRARYAFEYAIVADDFSLTYSPGLPATFFTETDHTRNTPHD